MTHRMTSASALLIIAACLPAGSCGDEAGSEPSGTRVVSEAGRAYAGAYCDLLERCAADFGRRWIDEAACYEGQIRILAGPTFEIWNPDAGEADILSCVDYLDGAACGDFYDQSEFRFTPPCDALFDPAPPAGLGPGGGDPVIECGACDEGSYCVAQSALGPVCRTCVAGADLGESCLDAPCLSDVGLVCDRGVTDTCVDAIGVPCTSDLACGSQGYYCDDTLGCQPRQVGTPCDRDWLVEADTGDALVCIDGLAALPSRLDEPCEGSLDCAIPSLTCLDGTCQPRRRRDAACVEVVTGGLGGSSGLGGLGLLSDSTCEGDLLCRGGVCADRPSAGEACDGLCQLPLLCVGTVCRAIPEGPPLPGDPCSVGLGAVPRSPADAVGYCDPMTGVWSDYLAQGEACGGMSGAVACGPAAYCDPTSQACTAYASLGADCESLRCRDTEAYCDPENVCQALRPIGAACADSGECDGAQCLGTCAGGEQSGLPCTAAWQCGTGECAGTCRADDDGWSACGS